MIHVERLLRVAHAVHDRAAAQRLYEDVFGAKLFHSGPLEAEGRDGCLLLISNLCIDLASAERDEGVGRFLAERGEGFCSVLFRVADLDEAQRHLGECGVRVARRTPSLLAVAPEDTLGVQFELTDRDLPGDPRLDGRWSGAYWRDEHPAGILGFWAVTTLAPDVAAARELYARVFGAELVSARPGVVASREVNFLALGRGVIGIMEPRASPSDLTKVVARQGTEGIHAVSGQLKSVPDAVRYFRSKGIGLVGSGEYYVMPHPRMCFGARFMMGRGPEPGDPMWELRRRFMGA